MKPERKPLRRAFPIGGRGGVVLALLLAAVLAAFALDMSLTGLWPRGAGLETARNFFALALRPDLSS